MAAIRALYTRIRPWQLALVALSLGVLIVLLWRSATERAPDFGHPPDFAAIEDTRQMKAAFLGYLTPMVRYQNDLIRQQRQRLQNIQARLENDKSIGKIDSASLEEVAQEYELAGIESEPLPLVKRLLRRVDVVPLDLALAQAAIESGWGRSRFAVEANNLFGQWCYQPGCGVVPSNRKAGAKHEVQRFPNVYEAIRRYMNNLNTHERYRALRGIRAELRSSSETVTGTALSHGLEFYSERRQEYVEEVQTMIRRNNKFESGTKSGSLSGAP